MAENLILQSQGETLAAITKSEIDMQIATAKAYKRSISEFLDKVETYAGMDEETAGDCFYALKRGKGDDAKIIEGLSVRFAEIIANCWGNLRIQTRIVAIDDKSITVQGMCHDLETNVAISTEVRRRITDKFGNRFSDDMIVVTGNAASSIAFRNAVLKIIPKAITKKVVEKIRDISLGKAIDIETARANAVEYFKKLGVTEKELLDHLELRSVQDIGKEDLLYLQGLKNSIKEGATTIDETFKNKGAEGEKRNVFGKKDDIKNVDAVIINETTQPQKTQETTHATQPSNEVKKEGGKKLF